MHADDFLPHKVEWRAGEPEGDELMDEHENYCSVPETIFGQEGECVGVV